MRIAEAFTTEAATRQVAKLAKDKGIPAAKLVAQFPERPANPAEFLAMTNWIMAMGGPATEGMYRKDGQIYKVQVAVHGSGHLYAKVLDVATLRFVKATGMVGRLTQVDRMSSAEAAEFGHLYGVCIRCAAPLTDEDSIARGMGPVCATKI